MHAISSYRGNRIANKQTHKHTNRQNRLQYTALLSLARSVTRTSTRIALGREHTSAKEVDVAKLSLLNKRNV